MYDLTYLSLGAGLQSTALGVMSALGIRDVPKADVAIFADTQAEPQYVYDHLHRFRTWLEDHGIPLVVATAGNLEESQLKATREKVPGDKFTSVPLWLIGKDGDATPGRRHCTHDYKIQVIEREVRRMLGYEKGERVHKSARALIGISWDERTRTKRSQTKWIQNTYPLVELQITTAGCRDVLERVGIPVPAKSACRFCPYHDDRYWDWLRKTHPDEWEKACVFDEKIRDQSATGMRSSAYVHRSLTPLRMVELQPGKDRYAEAGLFDSFAEECDGMCGV